jgi:hypothetical protein
MKRTRATVSFSIFLLLAISASAQGTFQNLDFEQANPVYDTASPLYPTDPVVTAASALPYWTVSYSTPVFQGTDLFLNTYTAGSPGIETFGPNNPATTAQPGAIDGHYSVFLEGGLNPPSTLVSASISQTGMVPVGSESLQFEVWRSLPSNSAITFDGNNLSPIVLGTGADYTLYGVNIAPFAGETGQLEFTSTLPESGLTLFGLDDISFSQTAVAPEPSPLILYGIGSLLLCARRWIRSPK